MLWIAIPYASACGMMACDQGPMVSPVIQNAERIAFAIDEEAGMVEAHVQIFYEGPPDQFAWVVPVTSEPEVFISTDALFNTLSTQLSPTVQLTQNTRGTCKGEGNRVSLSCGKSDASYAGETNDIDFRDTADPGVTVVSQTQVGPYDTTVLQANDESALITWLQDNSYDVPDGLGPLLAPYLAEGSHFLAVKLQKDNDIGDIAPLGWRYAGDQPAVPIQLTAIATAPDLGLEVSVFARHRVVPKSYLHVVINEANLDWFDNGSNYYDLVSRAADQAGGHAFATDYAGTTDGLKGLLWTEQQDADLGLLRLATTVDDWRRAWMALVLPDNANSEYALSQHLVMDPSGGRWADQIGFSSSFEGVDLEALTADVETYIVDPLKRAEALFEHQTVSRLSSSLDADEMTIDPVFVQNPAMEDVSNQYSATLWTDCTGKKRRFDAPRTLELNDGRVYQLPSLSAMGTEADSDYWTAKHSDVEAIRIEETGETGPPVVIADLFDDAVVLADGPVKACGCSGNALRGSGLVAILFGALLARRRRS